MYFNHTSIIYFSFIGVIKKKFVKTGTKKYIGGQV